MQIKITLLIFFIAILSACAAKIESIENIALYKAAEPIEPTSTSTVEFEDKPIPKSNIMQKSLIWFSESYQRVYNDSEVIDIAGGEFMLAVLKENEIGFTMPYCQGLVLKDKYSHITVDKFHAALYNNDFIEFFSAKSCASLNRVERVLHGGVAIFDHYILEWEGNTALLRNAFNGKVLYNGDTGYHILTAGSYMNRPMLLQNNGYILTYNEELGAFAIASSLPGGIDAIYSNEGLFYGVLDDTSFFVLDGKEVRISKEKNCKILINSVSGICEDEEKKKVLITTFERHKHIPEEAKWAVGKGTYAVLNISNLHIYYLTISTQRFVTTPAPKIEACIDSKNNVIFKSFSDKVYILSGERQEQISEFPKNCKRDNIIFNNGKFFCNSKECGTFATIVKTDGPVAMLKRIEDNITYYYFE